MRCLIAACVSLLFVVTLLLSMIFARCGVIFGKQEKTERMPVQAAAKAARPELSVSRPTLWPMGQKVDDQIFSCKCDSCKCACKCAACECTACKCKCGCDGDGAKTAIGPSGTATLPKLNRTIYPKLSEIPLDTKFWIFGVSIYHDPETNELWLDREAEAFSKDKTWSWVIRRDSGYELHIPDDGVIFAFRRPDKTIRVASVSLFKR